MTTLPVAGKPERSLRRRPPRRRHRHPFMLPLVVFAGLTFVAVGFVGYVLWPRWPAQEFAPDAPALPMVIAGVTFNVPQTAIRMPVQRRPGNHERIDLAFLWPSLEPAENASAKPAAPADGLSAPSPASERIFLTIAAAGSSVPVADRVLMIYPRYTVSEPIVGPGGLAVLAFRDGTPYQGEDLVYDPDAPGFLVRCSRPAGPTPGICLYERWIDAAKLVLRFPRDWLAEWRGVAERIELLIASLRPARS